MNKDRQRERERELGITSYALDKPTTQIEFVIVLWTFGCVLLSVAQLIHPLKMSN